MKDWIVLSVEREICFVLNAVWRFQLEANFVPIAGEN